MTQANHHHPSHEPRLRHEARLDRETRQVNEPPLAPIIASFLSAGLAFGVATALAPMLSFHGIGLVLAIGLASLVAALSSLILWRRMSRNLDTIAAERNRYHDTLESVTDGIWEADGEGRFTYVSTTLADRLGLAPESLLDGTTDVIPARKQDQHAMARMRNLMARHKPFRNISFRLQLPSGEVRQLQLSGRPRFNELGKLVGYIGTGSDVTAQGLAAERARLAETRLAAAIDGMAEGFALFDVHDRLELRNWRLDLLLRPAETDVATGADLKKLLLDAAADPEPVETFFAHRFANQARPLRLRTKDGRWLQVRLAPTSSNGTQTLWTDITRTVRQEEEEEQRRLERHHAQKLEAIGTLAGGIAHEINTPIQYIGDNLRFLDEAFRDMSRYISGVGLPPQGSVLHELWQETDMDFLMEEIPKALEQSEDGVRHVAKLVLSMKEFAHPAAREPIALDMAHAVETTLTVSRNEWKQAAEVAVLADDDVWPALGVPGEVNQVLLNLIVNAVHAVQDAGREPGRLTVSIRNAEIGDTPAVEVEVADNGVGMAPDVAQRIFDPFFTTKGVGRGSGQGLAIAHDIVVRKHAGSLAVQSTPGEGSRFTLRLPAAATAAPGGALDGMVPEESLDRAAQ